MIGEQVRSYQERERTRELVKIVQRVAKLKGESIKGGSVKGYRYEEGSLRVTSTVYPQPHGDWHFVTVQSQDRQVFAAGALRTRQTRGPLEFSISEQRPGPWEGHIRRLARSKPKNKR